MSKHIRVDGKLLQVNKLPQPLHLLKIYPESYDYLDSDLKKEGFEVRQHRGKYYN
jgi:hypothetical protein